MNRAEGRVARGREAGAVVRRLMLATVLGLLGVLILIMTADAYVARKTEDSLVDFDSGTFIHTGLLDLPEEDIHSVQLLPIGLTGGFRESVQKLPETLTNLAAVANGDMIYVIGGTGADNRVRRGVYSSIISGTDGELAAWNAEANTLPQGRAAAGVALHRLDEDSSVLYVVGGVNALRRSTDTVYRALVNNHTGEVGTWMTDTQHLPAALYSASAVEHNGYLYVIGGFSGPPSMLASQEVYYAPINAADGSLAGPFAATFSLPEPLYSGYAVVYEGVPMDTLYFIGGRSRYTSTFKVFFADFKGGGGLQDEWQLSKGKLPIHLYSHSGVLVNGREILVTGGIADPQNPAESYTNTVKVALVDPDNPSFRLFDWCLGVLPPTCTIGAWQTGGLLPEVRALHGTVTGQDYVYVVGGEGISGADKTPKPRDTVYIGTISGVEGGALYSPEGEYLSDRFDLGQAAKLKRLVWHATIGHPGRMGLTMQYRTKAEGAPRWSAWSAPVASGNMTNQLEFAPSFPDIRHFQYRANFSTVVTNASPLLDAVHIYYEVPDPDMAVAKDTGSVITVGLGSTLEYTIRYTNTGGWVAKNVALTETLPEHTSYVPSPGWHHVGSSDVYTYRVGDLERGAHGSVPFRVRVADNVPPGTYSITNRVETDYPAMIDEFNNTIVDPEPADNWYEFSNLLSLLALAISKDAEPPPGSTVTPGSRITYTLRYSNVGGAEASRVVLTDLFDPLDSYTVTTPSYIPPTATEYVWRIARLPARETDEITVVVQLDDPMPNHWLVTNQATLGSRESSLYHTPVITHMIMNQSDGDPVPMVDLTVANVDWTPSEPTSGTWPVFSATVVNQGNADASKGFWIALYIKPQPSYPPEWPADHDRGYCLSDCTVTRAHYVGYVYGLPKGDSVTITFANLDQSESPDFPTGGSYDIYVQADVAFQGDNWYWGACAEDDETNNIWRGLLTISADGPPKTYLPLVFKSAR